jgi:hypothetical protein
MRPIFIAAAAATSALFLAGVTMAEPIEQTEPAPPKPPARVAIDACHKAVERELLGKNPKNETVTYRGDSVYHASIEIIVNGALELPSPKDGARYFDYTCRYNERSEQTYGVKVEKGKP